MVLLTEFEGLSFLETLALLAFAFQVLCGFWGRSRAVEVGLNPWLGFAIGLFLGVVGVTLMNLFKVRAGDVAIEQERRTMGPIDQHQAYAPHPFPPQPQPFQPPLHTQAQAFPQPPPQAAPNPAPAAAQIPDAHGFIQCRACGTRVRAERRQCMQCGAQLG